jgi:rubrerythrin
VLVSYALIEGGIEMGNIFAGSEIVELGIQIEKNGQDFYNTLSAQTKNEKAKELFAYLAGEEAKHILVFKKILEKTTQYEPAGLDADEYYAYMNALASEHVFTQKNKGAEVAKRIKSAKEAIQMGISLEEDSIVFYQGVKKIIPQYDQTIVDQLIAQEESHLRQLIELKSKL